MTRWLLALALLVSGCTSPATPVLPVPPVLPMTTVGVSVWDAPGVPALAATGVLVPWDGTADLQGVNVAGRFTFRTTSTGGSTLLFSQAGYQTSSTPFTIAATGPDITLTPAFPAFPTRAQMLASHESFQGSVLQTTQFGPLNWWPAAWVSLSPADQAASYAQIKAWGDTDITVSVLWDYGEAGQPYGTGQQVPAADFRTRLPAYRALVEQVVQHGFIPVFFLDCDDGYAMCLAEIPSVVQALQPQPTDPVDLTQYGKFRICYDSCIPGWQPPSEIDGVLLALRQNCPLCVIGMEFSTGYPFWGGDGGGTADFLSPAGQALDELLFEGNAWPPPAATPSGGDQYWQVIDRWLGPCWVRPPDMPATDDTTPPWYLGAGTPRGVYGVHAFENLTYQWVRGQLPASVVPLDLALFRSFYAPASSTCPIYAVDLPQ
jgi:hypothetical protein